MQGLNVRLGLWVLAGLLALLPGWAAAQVAEPPPMVFSQEELDQLLAPVALYPDTLLTQVLVAATYPLEVIEAERFLKANPKLKGEALTTAAENKPWDLSVVSLLQFPSVVTMMSEKLDWTQQLGDAFLAQQGEVMDTVQSLRGRAQQAGNLKSSDQQRVVVQEKIIVIESPQPQVVYVPYYNPIVVYGSWWWPARPPMYWAPPPIYRPLGYGNPIVGGIFYGIGVGISNAIWNDYRPNWNNRQVNIVNNVTIINNRNANNGRPRPPGGGNWQHDPIHRKGVAYRDNQVRDRVTTGSTVRPGARPGTIDRRPVRGDDANLNLRPTPGGRDRPGARPDVKPGLPAVNRPQVLPARPDLRPETRPNGKPDARPAARPTPQARPSLIGPGGSREAIQAQADRGRRSREAMTRPAPRPAPAAQPAARPAPASRPALAARPAPNPGTARPAPGAAR